MIYKHKAHNAGMLTRPEVIKLINTINERKNNLNKYNIQQYKTKAKLRKTKKQELYKTNVKFRQKCSTSVQYNFYV